MPIQMRKLNQDEASRTFAPRGQMDLSEYVDALAALRPGDVAAMELGNLTARAAKRRLGQAANRLGHRLRWARATDTLVVSFQVLTRAKPRTQKPGGVSRLGHSRTASGRRTRAAVPTSEETPPLATENVSMQPRQGRRPNAVRSDN